MRAGSSSMCLRSRQVGLDEKERPCKGCAKCRHGRTRRCKSLMVRRATRLCPMQCNANLICKATTQWLACDSSEREWETSRHVLDSPVR